MLSKASSSHCHTNRAELTSHTNLPPVNQPASTLLRKHYLDYVCVTVLQKNAVQNFNSSLHEAHIQRPPNESSTVTDVELSGSKHGLFSLLVCWTGVTQAWRAKNTGDKI